MKRLLAGLLGGALVAGLAGGTAAASWKVLEGMTEEDVLAQHASDIRHIVTTSSSSADPDLNYTAVTTFVIGQRVVRCSEERRYSRATRQLETERACFELQK